MCLLGCVVYYKHRKQSEQIRRAMDASMVAIRIRPGNGVDLFSDFNPNNSVRI
jgi:hypothetical protein